MENKKIDLPQFTILVTLITVGDSILVLPAIPAALAKQDAWLSAILGLLIGLFVVYLLGTVGKLYPHLTLVEYNEKILGKWPGIVVSILFIFYPLLSVAAHVREIGDFTTTHIMTNTPVLMVNLIFVVIIVMGARLGIEVIARSGEIFFFFFTILFVVFVIALVPLIDLENVKPILEGGIKPVINGAFTVVAFPFMELLVFLMVLPYVNHQKKIRKSFLIGSLCGGLVLVIIIAFTILILGYDLTQRSFYPTFALAKMIRIGDFLERIEVILAVMWILTTYYKITFYFYILNLAIAQIVRIKEYKVLLYPMGMIITVLSIVISPNAAYFNDTISKYWPFYDSTFGVFLPLLLLTVAFIRKKHEKIGYN
ncbi:endospore germination permease [Rossellomorea aquimaris]|nr:endospore germination permease [Rossellomorea aquimaris]WRP08692.1 endospore germination permease [Rossellomorea aquimaris]